jgi:hypothetical protein
LTGLPQNLGKCVARDMTLLKKMGWKGFVAATRSRKDFAQLAFKHPAKRLLKHYKIHGVPVKVSTKPWTQEQCEQAIDRGPHRSCKDHLAFLSDEFVDMIEKGQWTILPYSVVKRFLNLRLSPPGVVPQRD